MKETQTQAVCLLDAKSRVCSSEDLSYDLQSSILSWRIESGLNYHAGFFFICCHIIFSVTRTSDFYFLHWLLDPLPSDCRETI